MDPYLEEPSIWPGVHLGLIYETQEALNAALPDGYVADIGERVYVLQPDRDLYPDLAVVRRRREPGVVERGRGGTATTEAGAPPWVFTIEPEEVREPYIEIHALGENQRVVTVIEFLSPANKAAGSKGRRLYLSKQRGLLKSRTHLVEIDFLRAGAHTVAISKDRLLRRGRWDYLVCVHHVDPPRRYWVWPILLRDRLPAIRIPLAGGDDDLPVDLQPILDRRYDSGRYALKLDYHTAPTPPLAEEDDKWAAALLTEHGLR
jgi:hypothetical protein